MVHSTFFKNQVANTDALQTHGIKGMGVLKKNTIRKTNDN